MTFGTVDIVNTYLYETNFFSNYGGSPYTVGIRSYGLPGGAGDGLFTGGDYGNPSLGGPADIVFEPGTVSGFPLVLVSDFGDGLIYQYRADSGGSLDAQTTYLSGISPPTYLAEFATTATFAGNYVVPEPSSLALCAAGLASLAVSAGRESRTRA